MTQPTNGNAPSIPSQVDKTIDLAATMPWAKPDSAGVSHATTRARRNVETLPDWEPLPPGEVNVRRRRD